MHVVLTMVAVMLLLSVASISLLRRLPPVSPQAGVVAAWARTFGLMLAAVAVPFGLPLLLAKRLAYRLMQGGGLTCPSCGASPPKPQWTREGVPACAAVCSRCAAPFFAPSV